ncbi:hypothetical protein M422DRAFT_256074 [Sphaerobolus stellatus SS14]|uniref:Uncharacterized protein n=1 Tax=Sphaerobolus stellatus (strain SS14) TaxID=990650 RepID=A0A0C9VS98_SPHS4|nr:hypothetical protein M422DRAFT_256074 [Sphaerobolus stellatus SS14]
MDHPLVSSVVNAISGLYQCLCCLLRTSATLVPSAHPMPPSAHSVLPPSLPPPPPLSPLPHRLQYYCQLPQCLLQDSKIFSNTVFGTSSSTTCLLTEVLLQLSLSFRL